MKVGFISEFEVENKKVWSGTINFLYETLSKCELCKKVTLKTIMDSKTS